LELGQVNGVGQRVRLKRQYLTTDRRFETGNETAEVEVRWKASDAICEEFKLTLILTNISGLAELEQSSIRVVVLRRSKSGL
jgi:hypothetical protein